MDELLETGRESFRKQAWNDAFIHLSNADKERPLSPEDLEITAISAYLTGRFNTCTEFWTRAHNGFLKDKNIPGAVQCAFWLGFVLLNKGEPARGGGWIGRANKLIAEGDVDCGERGYLFLPVGLRCLDEGDIDGSMKAFTQAYETGRQFHDPNLTALGRLGQGQAHILTGNPQKGVAFLDEAMIAVESESLSPIVVGIIYCAVIETCLEIFDLSRAQEWTDALSDWCSSHPHLVPFRGQCLTRRSEILLVHGEWVNAMHEANRAIDLLSHPNGEPAAGAAFYQLGNLYRMRGEFSKAEKAYSEAHKYGKSPQPGLALLRLAQGQLDKATSSITSALLETKNLKMRSEALFACAEIMLAAGNMEQARKAADELKQMAGSRAAPLLQALATQVEGRVLLAEDDAQSALECLRSAWKTWESLKAPFEAARTRMLIGRAYQKLGDEDAARMEFEAARWTFEQLNASPDAERAKQSLAEKSSGSGDGLTQRELQVLQLIAEGKSNRSIANELFISERTVERHVSNIFLKLDVSSRSAATAYAFKHEML